METSHYQIDKGHTSFCTICTVFWPMWLTVHKYNAWTHKLFSLHSGRQHAPYTVYCYWHFTAFSTDLLFFCWMCLDMLLQVSSTSESFITNRTCKWMLLTSVSYKMCSQISLCKKSLPHIPQTKVLKPVRLDVWVFNCEFLHIPSAQMLKTNNLFSECLNIWVFKLPCVLKFGRRKEYLQNGKKE